VIATESVRDLLTTTCDGSVGGRTTFLRGALLLVPLLAAAAVATGCGDSGGGGDNGDGADASNGGEGDGGRPDGRPRIDGSPADPPDGDGGTGPHCGGLPTTIRDFNKRVGTSTGHPDFEVYQGETETTGIVNTSLGSDGKPVLQALRGQVTSAESFAQWYRDVPDVNRTIQITLELDEVEPGKFRFDRTGDNNGFFPIDGQGFNEQSRDHAGTQHNFHFTTEIHTTFVYRGGEVFSFSGDDDLWLFINGRLAIDLGGLHKQRDGSVALDSLGLEVGKTYPMDIFHAERRTDRSNFKVETTIDCFLPPIDE
jgi:fibro-slime domain-containing protein